MEEKWKTIEEFPRYEVSNTGKIRNKETGYILKQIKHRGGYYSVSLYNEPSHAHTKQVHQIVANTWIPNPNNCSCINHKDENPENNNADNLEWCNHLYNNNYGNHNYKVGLALSKPVCQYDKNNTLVAIYNGAREAARIAGFSQSSITLCCQGKRKTHHGFIWKYK